ncbi:MAG: DUF1329 domain-containing protein [Steroidobacteraceae bacterium]|nr:DUF1329 domain-containing protein [Steroidobacteraceae bacterium]
MPGPDAKTLAAGLALATLLLAHGAEAAVTAQQAEALGATLTAVGAEKAGSADGRIPAYTGGLPTAPASAGHPDAGLADPFADEKPLRVLTASDLGGAESELTAGTLELLRTHPAFCVDVYPTHRTMADPEWFLANTLRNATDARLVEDNLTLENALPGIPFPIPRDGREVMWNHRLHYMGRAMEFKYDSWLVTSSGDRNLTTTAQSAWDFPAFDPKWTRPLRPDDALFRWKLDYSGPQRRAGEAFILIDSVDPLKDPRKTWLYVPGQRRAKRVEVPDDAPHSSSSGAYINDDAFVYTGVLERYDIKLLGKREMIVPYNTYRLTYHANIDDVLQKREINPELLRWELHRVWVVEATLKPGQHHVYGRRVFYVDEDSWAALASDEYDLDGKLLRVVYALPTYDYKAGVPFTVMHVAYNLDTGAYFLAFFPGSHSGVRYVESLPDRLWSPDAMAGSGLR